MKNKKIIIPLAAIGVLLVLLAGVMMIDGEKQPATVDSAAVPDETSFAGYVLEFNTDTVDRITVNTGDDEFTFVKKDISWVVESNEEISISTASVNSLAGALGGILYTEVVADGSITGADCGIDDNSPSVTFTSELGETTIRRGITTTDNKLSYIMISGSDDVYFADINCVDRVLRPLSAYRNSAAVNIDFDSLKAIELKSDIAVTVKKGSVDMESAVYNEWKITYPTELVARDDQIKAIFTDPLKSIQITAFVSDTGEFDKYGLATKDRYVALTDSTGQTRKVYFSDNIKGSYYISIDDKKTIYEIAAEAAPYVSANLMDLAERNIHLVKMANISSVTVKGDGLDYKVEFLENGGKINGSDVSFDNMNQKVFASLCGLFADEINLEASGSAAVTMTFNYKNSASDVITFADYNERYYAVAKNGSQKYLILKHKLTDMAKILDECKE